MKAANQIEYRFARIAPLAICLCASAFGASVFGQSGRVKKPLPSVIEIGTREEPARKPADSGSESPQSGGSRPRKPTGVVVDPTPDSKTNKTGSAEDVSPEDIIRVKTNLVTVPASVVGADGKIIDNLKLEDFVLKVDGEKKSIAELHKSDSPVRLALLFDNSSSLHASRELEKQAAIKFFKNVMRPVDQAAIYDVYNEVVLAHPLTSDVRALVQTIENFGKPEGATSLFDAIAEASRYLYPNQGRKVIVVVSDGADTTSQLDFESTVRRALTADCQVYVVQTGLTHNANLRDLMAERRMQELTAQTGGAVYTPQSTSDLDVAFRQIAADLAQQYVLDYYPNDDPYDGKFRTIDLSVQSRPQARIRTRKGYYSPKPRRS